MIGAFSKYKPYWSESLNKELLMSKSTKELEKIGRKHGVEIDKRKKKETLVNEVFSALQDKKDPEKREKKTPGLSYLNGTFTPVPGERLT